MPRLGREAGVDPHLAEEPAEDPDGDPRARAPPSSTPQLGHEAGADPQLAEGLAEEPSRDIRGRAPPSSRPQRRLPRPGPERTIGSHHCRWRCCLPRPPR